jgi:hypothetical protein
MVRTEVGPIELAIPRDCNGSFEPKIVPRVTATGRGTACRRPAPMCSALSCAGRSPCEAEAHSSGVSQAVTTQRRVAADIADDSGTA